MVHKKTEDGNCNWWSATLCETPLQKAVNYFIENHKHIRTTLSDIVLKMNDMRSDLNKCQDEVKNVFKNSQSELMKVIKTCQSNTVYLYRVKEKMILKYESEKREMMSEKLQLVERIKHIEIINAKLKAQIKVNNDTQT